MRLNRIWMIVLGLGLLVVMGTLAFLLAGPRSAVDWSRLRTVTIESDDWGLAGFAPSIDAWDGIDRQLLAPGNFPPVYWNSTLEDKLVVAEMASILQAHVGRDGLPAVFQPNYVTGSWEWFPASESWVSRDWPEVPSHYARPGLKTAVDRAVEMGVWYPELHARWHYDPLMRQEASFQDANARRALLQGITLFPGSEKARELGPWRSLDDLARELDDSMQAFSRVFGRLPGSVIAPDYTWNRDLENLWESRGLMTIQAKREQRNPALGYGLTGRLKKFLARRIAAWLHPDRRYLDRNVRLEPVQAPDPENVIDQALTDTRRAWSRGEPAIVETHRVNFAHLESAVADKGQQALSAYLQGVTHSESPAPVFLADREVAGLQGGGVSWIQRGKTVVLRNGTHNQRVISLPAQALPPEFRTGGSASLALVNVPALSTIVVEEAGNWRLCAFER